jgi:hypothetical protein
MNARRPLWLLLIAIPLSVVGCGSDQPAPHREHVIPAHWPADLPDARTKILERLEITSGATLPAAELRDIIGWLPEIAADTRLSESQWLPIHVACDALSQRLRQTTPPWDAATIQQLSALCELLETQATTISGSPASSPNQTAPIATPDAATQETTENPSLTADHQDETAEAGR